MLFDRIKADIIKALKGKDKLRKDLLVTIKGELEKSCVLGDNGTKLAPSDEACIKMFKKFKCNAEDTLGILLSQKGPCQNGCIYPCEEEIMILDEYIPKQMSDEALKKAIEYTVGINTIPKEMKNMGLVMKHLQADYAGRYDGKRASELVKEFLTQ